MKKLSITLSFLLALVALATWAPNASAYSDYFSGCQNCHGDFFAEGYVSNTAQDGVAWNSSLHSGHQSFASCTACHMDIGDVPAIAGPSGDGYNSCMGCHGRDEDANSMGQGPGRGAGLRQHHWVNGITTTCSGCHPDSNPANFTPVGEDVPGARNAALGIDSCNDTVFGIFGSDNNGDNLYDGNDPACAVVVCGDGNVDVGEQCDDGNTANNDGCSSTCQNEVCGDGIQQTNEACDDGNTTNGDGCENDCTVTPPPDPFCGDGNVDVGEQCDDGNTANNDGCSSTCQNEVCGDGIQQTNEACDDGNTTNGDGCENDCTVTPPPDPFCGDGNVDVGEQCDDGNTANNDGCSSTCQNEVCGDGIQQTNEACDDGNTTNGDGCENDCTVTPPPDPFCGDGNVDVGEQCDDGNTANNDGCSSTCQNEVCGDGIQQTNEACDDGNTTNGDGCENDCTVTPPPDPFCGDGNVDVGEQCDDGNTANNDGCSSTCQNEVCGDGIQQTNEACDDGNTTNGDGCENDCTVTPPPDPFCGDGNVDVGEQCDDGNTANNDGCSSTCQNEVCGDGIQQTNEECDDGNNVDNDGCQGNCILPICPGGDDTDTDKDGTPDCIDACVDDANKTEVGFCGCGVPETDSDADGIKDCVDNAPSIPNPDQNDTDGDGVGDAAEQGPNGDDDQYDGNNDGTPDLQQNNVSSLFVNYGQDYVTLSTQEGCSLENVVNLPTDQLENLPEGVDFLFGMFKFSVFDCLPIQGPAGALMITFHMPENTNQPDAITVNTYFKFGPTPDNIQNHWYEFLYDEGSETGTEFLDDDVFMYFVDGARGDDIVNVVDGIIIDQGGPAFVDGVTSTGSNSSGWCFIATAAYGSSWEPHVVALRQFRDEYLLTNKLGTKFVKTYYRFSPPMAKYIAEHDSLRSVARIGLAPLVGFSWLAMNYGMIVTLAILISMITLIVGGTCIMIRTREAN